MAKAEKLVALTGSDKKNRSGRRAFVLAKGIGATEIAYDVTDAELIVAANEMLAMMKKLQSAAAQSVSLRPRAS